MARLFGFDYKSPYFYMVTLKALRGVEAFSQIGPKGLIEILEKSWHDWIVKKSGQLAAFRRYIKENPARAHLRLFRLLSPLGDLESWRSGGVKLLNSQSPKLQEAKAKKLKRLVVSG